MKKIIIFLFAMSFLLLMVACNQGKISDDLIIEIGSSGKFSEKEINDAVKVVKDNFNFPASRLLKIWYDEEESNHHTDTYLKHGRGSENGVEGENVIVILTNFYVDDSGNNPVLNPDSTYEDYQWILIRDDKSSEWLIDDAGY